MIKSTNRTKTTAEVFTPTLLVREMLDKLPADNWLPGKTFLDNSCGNSQFLAEVFIYKLNNQTPEDALKDIYGVDLMADNISDSVARLYCLSQYGINIIDENAEFLINHPEYADNHDYNWLKDNTTTFNRHYHGILEGQEIDVNVKFEYFDKGNGAVFSCNGMIFPNIVCHDALTYDYSFEKRSEEDQKKIEKRKNILKW